MSMSDSESDIALMLKINKNIRSSMMLHLQPDLEVMHHLMLLDEFEEE
jgi:hypothetical protein